MSGWILDPRAGDIISLDNTKAGSLVMSSSLANYTATSTDAVRMFARQDAFRAVAEAIAQSMAAVPYNEYSRDDVKGRQKLQPSEDKVAAALDEPYPGQTQYQWIEAMQLDRILHDRCATWLLTQEDGSVQFLRLPGRWISFVLDGLYRIVGAVVWSRQGGISPLIPIEQLIFDVGYDPVIGGEYTNGFAVSHALEGAATELEKGSAYREAMLAGGPKVPMYIKRPVDAPDWLKNGGRDRFIETFASYNSTRAGQSPILEDGMELAAAPQLDANNVDYRNARVSAQIEIAIAMHFPPELIGYRVGTNSNLETLREQLYVDVLGNRIAAFRQVINGGLRRAKLLPIDRSRYVEENIGARLASTPEKQASVLQTQVGAPIRTRNEGRALLNLSKVEGGDDLITPLNVTAGGLASPTDTGPKPGDPPGGAEGADNLDKSGMEFMIKAVTEAGMKAVSAAQRNRFSIELKAAMSKQADRVRKGLGDESSPGPLSDAFDQVAEDKALHNVIYPHSVAIAEAGAAAVLAKYNPTSENFSNEVMLPWLSKASQSNATAINAGVLGSLAAAIGGDIDWHDAVDAVLEHAIGAGSDLWSAGISQTSEQFGMHDAAKASGLGNKTWHWNPGTSGNGRPEHEAMDGETVGIDEVFSNGGRYPGDPSLGADENAQCGCTVEYTPGSKDDES